MKKVKQKFELVYGKAGNITNIMPFNASTINSFMIPADEAIYVQNLAMMHGRSKSLVGSDIILKHAEECKPVYIDDYPLAGFINKDGNAYANVQIINATNTSDYTPADVYSMYLYALSLKYFIKADAKLENTEADVAAFIFAIFMKFYGKKSGLVGSHSDLMPKLRYLITLYVHCGMLNNPDNKITRRRISSRMYSTFDDMDLNFDFTTIGGMLKAMNKNRIVSISLNTFSNQVVRFGGVQSLPMFEDITRFYTTILAGTVSGSKIFSSYWSKVMPKLHDRLVMRGLNHLNRSVR